MTPPTLKFRDLNPVGRITILVIGLLTLGIAAVAFALSYDALYAWVSSLNLWSDKANRIFPLLLDAAFIIAQGAAILAGVMRAVLGNDNEVHRGWPITAMLISGSLTIWFNVLHAGPSWSQRMAAALPPVLMMVAFEIDVSIVKWVMKALGKPLHQTTSLAPGMLPGGYPTPYQLPYPGQAPTVVYRPDVGGYVMVPQAGQQPMMTPPPMQPTQPPAPPEAAKNQEPLPLNGQNGTPDGVSSGGRAADQRAKVEAYLEALQANGRLDRSVTGRQVAQATGVSLRTAQPILAEYKTLLGIPGGSNGNGTKPPRRSLRKRG